jgi:hypothetical protein
MLKFKRKINCRSLQLSIPLNRIQLLEILLGGSVYQRLDFKNDCPLVNNDHGMEIAGTLFLRCGVQYP